MTMLMIARAELHDQAAFAAYVEGAGALMRAHEVEVVLRGTFDHTLKGAEQGAHIVAAFRYRDRAHLDGFFNDPAYAELVPLRDAGCAMEFQVYEEL
jgi:uncharacterized protein (DUF1330 family)